MRHEGDEPFALPFVRQVQDNGGLPFPGARRVGDGGEGGLGIRRPGEVRDEINVRRGRVRRHLPYHLFNHCPCCFGGGAFQEEEVKRTWPLTIAASKGPCELGERADE